MATDAVPIIEDGPVEPDSLCWRGELYTDLRPVQFRLLADLWAGRNRTRQIDYLGPVFGLSPDDRPERHQFAPAASRLNAWFAWRGLPFKVRKRGHYLQLLELPE